MPTMNRLLKSSVGEMLKATHRDGNMRVLADDTDPQDPREWLYALDLAQMLKPEDSSLN